MADNTLLNAGTGGDTVRDLARQAGSVKTQVVQLDLGGAAANAEVLITAGQQTMAASVPVAIASNQTKLPIADSELGSISAFPATFLRTTDEPRQVFYDPFDAALDTVNTWAAPTVNAPGIIAAVASGVMTMGTGATASGWSKLTSAGTFKLSIPAWLGFSSALSFSDLAAPNVNATRFWGQGSIPVTPTVGVPITDGMGFELSGAKMYAVVYAAGVRTVVQDLSAATGNGKQPTDTANHRYIVYVRTDKAYWYIDGLNAASLVATSNFQSPAIQTLGAAFVAVGNASNAVNAPIACAGTAVWDTGKNATQLSDGQFPWRKGTVKPASTAVVSTDTALAVGIHPSSNIVAQADVSGNATLTAASSFGLLNASSFDATVPGAGSFLTVTLNGRSNISCFVTGTWSGQLGYDGSIDGTNWVGLGAVDAGGANVTSQSVNGFRRINASGMLYVRFRMTNAAFTGSAVINYVASAAVAEIQLAGSIPYGTADIGNVNVKNYVYADTGNQAWTNATTVGTAITATTNANGVPLAGAVMIIMSGTYAFGATTDIVFEGSTDNTNWFPIMAARVDGQATEIKTGNLVANTVRAWHAAISGVQQFRVRLTGAVLASGTLNTRIVVGAMPFAPVAIVNNPKIPTYRAATAALVAAPNGTTPFLVIQGAANRIVKIRKIRLDGISFSTVVGPFFVNINSAKYSTAASGGTAVALVKLPLDSNSPASALNLLSVYSVAPTAGTKVAEISSRRVLIQTATAAAGTSLSYVELDFSSEADEQDVTLRGIAEGVAMYCPVAPGGILNMTAMVEWTEE